MKVSVEQLSAVVSACGYVLGTNGITENESLVILDFLKSFHLSDETLRKVLERQQAMDLQTTLRVLDTLDDDAKQECSNQLLHCVMSEDDYQQKTYEAFAAIINGTSLPAPDSHEWDVLMEAIGKSDDGEELLSNEDTEICDNGLKDRYFLDNANPYYLEIRQDFKFPNCCTAVSLESYDAWSDEAIAKNMLACTEGVLFEYKNVQILGDITEACGWSPFGKLVFCICKKPMYGVENKAASELLGKTVYGSCIIRFLHNTGYHTGLHLSDCRLVYQELKNRLRNPLRTDNSMD